MSTIGWISHLAQFRQWTLKMNKKRKEEELPSLTLVWKALAWIFQSSLTANGVEMARKYSLGDRTLSQLMAADGWERATLRGFEVIKMLAFASFLGALKALKHSLLIIWAISHTPSRHFFIQFNGPHFFSFVLINEIFFHGGNRENFRMNLLSRELCFCEYFFYDSSCLIHPTLKLKHTIIFQLNFQFSSSSFSHFSSPRWI